MQRFRPITLLFCGALACTNNAPLDDCEPAEPPLEIRTSLALDPLARVWATLWVFRGACPAPGQEASGDVAAKGNPVPVASSATLDFNATVPFRELARPPGPWASYCTRVVYSADGAFENAGRYQFFNRQAFTQLRLAHQDGEALTRLTPFGRRCVKLGPLQGGGADADRAIYDDDGDGVPNLQEVRLGLRPNDSDGLDLTSDGGTGGYATVPVPETSNYVFGGIPHDGGLAFESEQPEVGGLHVDRLDVDVLEVTNRQYRVCMGKVVAADGGSSFACSAPEVAVFEGPDLRLAATPFDLHPVVGVTHAQAQAFCRARGMRLPTELEWERAARMTSEGVFTLYPWGEEQPALHDANNPCTYGRFTLYSGTLAVPCANSARMDTGEGMDASGALVRTPPQNNQLMDMAGNVAEWAEDNFVADLHERVRDSGVRVWQDPASSVFTVRGGSFRSGARFVMAQARSGVDDAASNRAETLRAVGFRCVATVLP